MKVIKPFMIKVTLIWWCVWDKLILKTMAQSWFLKSFVSHVHVAVYIGVWVFVCVCVYALLSLLCFCFFFGHFNQIVNLMLTKIILFWLS